MKPKFPELEIQLKEWIKEQTIGNGSAVTVSKARKQMLILVQRYKT